VVKLADLGGAKVIKQSIMSNFSHLGTDYYMSPEMLNLQDYSFPTDIWYSVYFCILLICLKKIYLFEIGIKVAWLCSLRVGVFGLCS